MRSLKTLAASGVLAASLTAPAFAADLGLPPPPVLAPVIETSGWYLRGDIGFSNQRVRKLDNALFATTPVTILDKGFDAAPFIGIGAGYRFNSWIRTDVTGEYRGGASFHGLDNYVDPALPAGFGANDYRATKSEWTGLWNLYFDLGTWHSLTPFIGGGIGASYNTIDGFRDTNVPAAGVAYAKAASRWNFAWALYAGLAYAVTDNLTMEVAYRYLDLGNGETGDITTFNGVNTIVNPMRFKDITSHDIKLGMRWALGGPSYTPSAPLVRKY